LACTLDELLVRWRESLVTSLLLQETALTFRPMIIRKHYGFFSRLAWRYGLCATVMVGKGRNLKRDEDPKCRIANSDIAGRKELGDHRGLCRFACRNPTRVQSQAAAGAGPNDNSAGRPSSATMYSTENWRPWRRRATYGSRVSYVWPVDPG